MIKSITPGDDTQSQKPVSEKADTSTVNQGDAEQFTSSLHKKDQSELKKLSKSKAKIGQSIDKLEARLSKQAGQGEVPVHRKHSDSERSPSDHKMPHQKVASADQSDTSSSTKEDLPQNLDAVDISAIIAQNQATAHSAAPAEVQPASPPTPNLNQLVGEIADRILVSSPADNPAGTQEIRIHLKESVLAHTEVRIHRHAGSLQIEFVTTSKDSQMYIEQRQPDIQKVLGERLKDETVNVVVQEGQQTRGGEGEGRSRQQYINPYQEDDKE